MLDAAIQGMQTLLNLNVALYMILGVFVGVFLGAIPGMTGQVILAILIPFVIGTDPVTAMALLLGAHVAVEFGGSISSILINTPASGQTIATCFDGYPMSQKGEAARALSISATSSAVGGLFGFVVLVFSLPLMKAVLMVLGAPEYFIMTFVGLIFIAVLGGKSLPKALISGGIGLMLAMVGEDPMTGTARFSMGTMYLWDGIPLIPAVIGLFAFSGMAEIFSKGGSISRLSETEVKAGGVLQGVKDVFQNWWMCVKCSAIGTFIGIVPGLGGTVANLLAYGYASRSSRNSDKFGTGWPEGVLAPESANNSKEGGALVPTIAFGIPGSAAMAIMLGVFIMLGLVPGPDMLGKNLHVTFSLAFILAIANILATGIGLVIARYLAKFTFMPLEYVVPSVLVVGSLGAYLDGNEFGNVILALLFGLLGLAMQRYKYPKAPLIIGLVLGGIVERYLHLSIRIYGSFFFIRPICLALIVLVIIVLAYKPIMDRRKEMKKAGEAA